MSYTSDIAFTETVKQFQEKSGSRSGYARMEQQGGWHTKISSSLERFLEDIDTFYLSTSNANGQPYTQHRGGPKGFLKVLDDQTLAFADFSGNKQYITIGNLEENNKAYIFLMNYRTQTRIKIWGTAYVDDQDQELIRSLSNEDYKARLERAIIFKVKVWDMNCRQHIKQRFTGEEVASVTDPLYKRIKELEKRVQELTANG